MKNAPIALLLVLACGGAEASSCRGIGRHLTNEQKVAWAPVLASQLQVESVEVVTAFVYNDWRIVYVDAPNSDSPFLFFSQSPLNSHFVTLWSGAATASETKEIKAWAAKNAPGIPDALAGCFAWYVTKARQ